MMTISTLDQISAYSSTRQENLIPQTSTTQNIQDRDSNLNRELLNAIGQAELERTQNSTINTVSLSDETRQLVVAAAGHNSTQRQIEIYVNAQNSNNSYQANTINISNLLDYQQNPSILPELYA